jgi:hypothetical protein
MRLPKAEKDEEDTMIVSYTHEPDVQGTSPAEWFALRDALERDWDAIVVMEVSLGGVTYRIRGAHNEGLKDEQVRYWLSGYWVGRRGAAFFAGLATEHKACGEHWHRYR